jgi:predicted dehydrogenase
MPRTVNIAVVGAGTMAQAVHLPVLRRRWDRFAVTALVDHSPRRREESSKVWGVAEQARYESVADLIAAIRAKTVEVDGVLLSTDGLHVEDLLAIIKRGLPVLVEPPLGYSAEEVSRITDFERMLGRRLVMMAYPQQYDEVLGEISEHIRQRDVRLLDHEVLMPASQPLFGQAHVTSSAYDLPTEVRKQRRTDLKDAVAVGTGEGATQRDRDLYTKGLLDGVAHQLAVAERIYGPLTEVTAVRHWPKGVIPGSIEILGELDGGEPVHLIWHYLPFAPEYVEHLRVLSARRRIDVDLAAPSHGDEHSRFTLREKEKSRVVETSRASGTGSAEAMWEAFHAFIDKGTEPYSGAAEALAHVTLMHDVLARLVEDDGRSLEPEPEEPEGSEDSSDGSGESEEASDQGKTETEGADAPSTETEQTEDPTVESAAASTTETAASAAQDETVEEPEGAEVALEEESRTPPEDDASAGQEPTAQEPAAQESAPGEPRQDD